MSHGTHAVQHEVEHQIEHEEGHGGPGGHGGGIASSLNKRIALLISVMALFLAISETLGKSAQTEGIALNIRASDTWNFFQAKTIRQTTLRVAAQGMRLEAAATADETKKAAMLKQADDWMATVARYDSDPKEKDGRKELRAQAESLRTPARHLAGQVSPLRVRLGGLPDRHRAGVGRGHHRHGGARVGGDRARLLRPGIHGARVFQPGLSAPSAHYLAGKDERAGEACVSAIGRSSN